MACEITVGKIKAHDVHACSDHFLQNFRGIRGRSDGADNSGFIGSEGHGVSSYFRFRILEFGLWIEVSQEFIISYFVDC
jgi:hypothetical protein